MALTEFVISILVLVAVIYLGLKIVKNVIITAIMIAVLAGILYYFGYLLPFW